MWDTTYESTVLPTKVKEGHVLRKKLRSWTQSVAGPSETHPIATLDTLA